MNKDIRNKVNIFGFSLAMILIWIFMIWFIFAFADYKIKEIKRVGLKNIVSEYWEGEEK